MPYVAPPLRLKSWSLDSGDNGGLSAKLSSVEIGGVWTREGLLDWRGTVKLLLELICGTSWTEL